MFRLIHFAIATLVLIVSIPLPVYAGDEIQIVGTRYFDNSRELLLNRDEQRPNAFAISYQTGSNSNHVNYVSYQENNGSVSYGAAKGSEFDLHFNIFTREAYKALSETIVRRAGGVQNGAVIKDIVIINFGSDGGVDGITLKKEIINSNAEIAVGALGVNEKNNVDNKSTDVDFTQGLDDLIKLLNKKKG